MMLYKKAVMGAVLMSKAILRPRLIRYALRVRGWRYVVDTFMRSDAETIHSLFRDLQFRSLPPTAENLRAQFSGVRNVAEHDPHLFEVSLACGERFLIRRSHAWSDLGVVHSTFVDEIYGEHPDVAGKTVLDVGANLGDTAVYFAKRGARVVAYEPDPELYALALRNVRINQIDVDLRNTGIGCAAETLPLSTTRTGADSTSTTIFPQNGPAGRLRVRTIPVRIVPLSDVLAELASVFLLKIDCEGCEYPALRSLAAADLRRIEHVIMECHGRRDELAEVLRRSGYRVDLRGDQYVYADRVDAREGALAPRRE
jgi:FkbM family methyltransferase